MSRGLLQVYTGPGKGKTTAAVGLAVRALSRGLNVLFAQFMKPAKGGETELLEQLGARVLRFPEVSSPLFDPSIDRNTLAARASEALMKLEGAFEGNDLAVLDEFNHLLSEKLVGRPEAESLIKGRPEGLELVLTGRGAPGWLLEAADLVTEMTEIKHPRSGGGKARRGIEF
jgi:cob(I)alamin adenosyltransferase